jgi:hypothetical protein
MLSISTLFGVGVEHLLFLEFFDCRRGGEHLHLADSNSVRPAF